MWFVLVSELSQLSSSKQNRGSRLTRIFFFFLLNSCDCCSVYLQLGSVTAASLEWAEAKGLSAECLIKSWPQRVSQLTGPQPLGPAPLVVKMSRGVEIQLCELSALWFLMEGESEVSPVGNARVSEVFPESRCILPTVQLFWQGRVYTMPWNLLHTSEMGGSWLWLRMKIWKRKQDVDARSGGY